MPAKEIAAAGVRAAGGASGRDAEAKAPPTAIQSRARTIIEVKTPWIRAPSRTPT